MYTHDDAIRDLDTVSKPTTYVHSFNGVNGTFRTVCYDKEAARLRKYIERLEEVIKLSKGLHVGFSYEPSDTFTCPVCESLKKVGL